MAGLERRWTPAEKAIVVEHYALATPPREIAAHLPGRTIQQLQNYANSLGLARQRPARRSHEEYLESKREGMVRARARDPEYAKERHKRWRNENIDRERAKMRAYHARRFFWSKAMKLRGEGRATACDLASLWRRQRGLCALSGQRLDRSAHVDHIIPKTRGGTDDIANLQWLCLEVNMAKRAMLQDEFTTMCQAVAAWTART